MPIADWLYSLVLLLNLTGLFSFTAPLLGVKVAAVSAAMLVFNLLYLGYRAPLTWRVMQRPLVLVWAVILCWWPLLTAIYAPVVSTRHLGLQLYNLSLVLGAAVFTIANGWPALRRLAGLAVAVTAFGLVLSWMEPGLFTAVSRLTQSREQYGGRAFGFFLQPNMAAENTIYMSVLWMAGDRVVSVARTWARVVTMALTVLVTGSRSGFAAASLIGILGVAQSGVRAGLRHRLSRGVRLLKAAVVLLVASGSFFLLLSTVNTSSEGLLSGSLQRASSVLALDSGRRVAVDGSAVERVVAIAQYAGLVAQRPFGGYGLGSSDNFRERGLLIRSSHNAFIEASLNFGIPYVVAMVVALLATVRHGNRQAVEGGLGTGVVLQLVAAIALTGMVSNTILDSRVLLVALGAVIGALIAPTGVVAPGRGRPKSGAPMGTAPRPAPA